MVERRQYLQQFTVSGMIKGVLQLREQIAAGSISAHPEVVFYCHPEILQGSVKKALKLHGILRELSHLEKPSKAFSRRASSGLRRMKRDMQLEIDQHLENLAEEMKQQQRGVGQQPAEGSSSRSSYQ